MIGSHLNFRYNDPIKQHLKKTEQVQPRMDADYVSAGSGAFSKRTF